MAVKIMWRIEYFSYGVVLFKRTKMKSGEHADWNQAQLTLGMKRTQKGHRTLLFPICSQRDRR